MATTVEPPPNATGTTDGSPRDVLNRALAQMAYFSSGTDATRLVEVEPLIGGLQNTNYRVTCANGDRFVVRIPAPDAKDHGQGVC